METSAGLIVWIGALIGAFIVGVIIGYMVRPRIPGWTPPKVTRIGPDDSTFAHSHDCPIWAELDQEMDLSSINSNTVIVKAYPNDNETPVPGSIVAGTRVLMFLPQGDYPTGTGDTVVRMTLIGDDTGSGAIKSKIGVALDGDGDNKAGGDYVHDFQIPG